MMISGIEFDRLAGSQAFLAELVWETIDHPDRLSRLRSFPYDRFKIYTVVPIVQIELNFGMRPRSSQSSGSFAIIWVVFPLRSS